VAAVHQAAEALACVAAADLQEVDLAARAGRLYAPTRTLPESYDVPRPFGNATPADVADLLDTYRKAAGASAQAATALDTVAVILDAPSRTLAAARAATVPAQVARTPSPADSHPADPAGTIPGLRDYRGRRKPGSVEQAVRRLGAPDPVLVLRAAAIDKAARKLITEAEQASALRRGSPQAPEATRQNPAVPTAARAAAESFPQGLATPTASKPTASRPAAAGPRAPRHPTAQGRQRIR
jgi:hypothetical protein